MSDLNKKVFINNIICNGEHCPTAQCCPGTTPDTPGTPDTPDNPNPGGAPAAHAPTHAVGGSDVLEYSSLSGLPDLSLKQDKLPDVAGNEGKFLVVKTGSLAWEHASFRPVSNLYVSPAGNDLNSGAKDSPMQTIEGAVAKIHSLTLPHSSNVSINLDSGLYTPDEIVIGARNITLIGKNDYSSKIKSRLTVFNITLQSSVHIKNIEFDRTNQSGCREFVFNNSLGFIEDIQVKGTPSLTGLPFIDCLNRGTCSIFGTIVFTDIKEGTVGLFWARRNSIINTNPNVNIKFAGNCSAISTFASDQLSYIEVHLNYVTFSGSIAGKRYVATGNSIVNTSGGGPNFIPGTIAGTVATGGQYL